MISKMKFLQTWLFLAALLFAGCDPNDDVIPEEELPIERDVYVAGFEEDQGYFAARFWKNGEVQTLADGRLLPSECKTASRVLSVFVSGDDVYVAGYDIIVTGDNWTEEDGVVLTHGDESVCRARLWKNGEVQPLASTYSDRALSVFVSGEDVYVLGSDMPSPQTSPKLQSFKIWKNGEAEIFAQGSVEWAVNSLFVSEGDVYVAGSKPTPSGSRAVLWKNGVEEILTSEAINSYANSVFVSDKDVYVAGYGYYLLNNHHVSFAKLWKNGKVENLTSGTEFGKAYSVYVSNGDVYAAGEDNGKARLWKNGVVQDIADDEKARMYLSVFVSGEDVYLSGCVEASVPSGNATLVYPQAALWKNGQRLNLDVKEGSQSEALSVSVK